MANPVGKINQGIPVIYNVGDFQPLPRDILTVIFSYLGTDKTAFLRACKYFNSFKITFISLKPQTLISKDPEDTDERCRLISKFNFTGLAVNAQFIAVFSNNKLEIHNRSDFSLVRREHPEKVHYQDGSALYAELIEKQFIVSTNYAKPRLYPTSEAPVSRVPLGEGANSNKINTNSQGLIAVTKERMAHTENAGILILNSDGSVKTQFSNGNPVGDITCEAIALGEKTLYTLSRVLNLPNRPNDQGLLKQIDFAGQVINELYIDGCPQSCPMTLHNDFLIFTVSGGVIQIHDAATLNPLYSCTVKDYSGLNNDVMKIHSYRGNCYLEMSSNSMIRLEFNGPIVNFHYFRKTLTQDENKKDIVGFSPKIQDVIFHENYIVIATSKRSEKGQNGIEFWSLSGEFIGKIPTAREPLKVRIDSGELFVTFDDGTLSVWPKEKIKEELKIQNKTKPEQTPEKSSGGFNPFSWFWSLIKSCFGMRK
jgi:hypothetical protein